MVIGWGKFLENFLLSIGNCYDFRDRLNLLGEHLLLSVETGINGSGLSCVSWENLFMDFDY